MKVTTRDLDPNDGGAADRSPDGLDDQVWAHVEAILTTAYRGEADAMAAQL